MKKVFVCILEQGSVCAKMTDFLVQMVTESLNDYDILYYHSNIMVVDNNRNTIVKKFLATDYDYLLMIDADTVPSANPLPLMEYEKDIISLPMPVGKFRDGKLQIAFTLYKEKDNKMIPIKYEGESFHQVDLGGTGTMLIKREVLENIKAPFMSAWNKDGIRTVGSDLRFCQKARKKGYESWTHWDFMCEHYKQVDLLKILKSA